MATDNCNSTTWDRHRLSRFLSHAFRSHDIVDSEAFRADLIAEAGCDADWPTHSAAEVRKAVEENVEDGGGYLEDPAFEGRLAEATEIIGALGHKYVPGFLPWRASPDRVRIFYNDLAQIQKAEIEGTLLQPQNN